MIHYTVRLQGSKADKPKLAGTCETLQQLVDRIELHFDRPMNCFCNIRDGRLDVEVWPAKERL